ncbi:MAG: ABC transporter ATP-binding protein [Bacteroidetes bacterium]|nr:ABC transporter ATP-binding protein [Fibrella sp.]
MIRVRNLTKQFGDKNAVDDVSFEVAAGETLVLLGTSGCGKTTTLKMLNRLVEPTAGSITIDGRDIGERPLHELRRDIGYVIQDTGLLPHYTIGENIATVPRLLGWEAKRIRQRTRELLTMLRLPDSYLNRYPDELSGGQRQRVGLARALAADPPVVLMDEPFGALDPVTRVGIRREFRRLDALQRKTIVLVTHDVAEAFELGDRICLMDQGRIQQMGPPKELLSKPANGFVRDFFADQRLNLQLQTTMVQDILPYFPHPSAWPLTMPVGEVLNQLTDTKMGNALAAEVLSALGQYMTHQAA